MSLCPVVTRGHTWHWTAAVSEGQAWRPDRREQHSCPSFLLPSASRRPEPTRNREVRPKPRAGGGHGDPAAPLQVRADLCPDGCTSPGTSLLLEPL